MAAYNWFEQPEKYKNVIEHLGISESSYLSLMDSIKKVFPEKWISEELSKHDRRYSPVIKGDLLPGLFRRLQYNPVPITLGVTCGNFVHLIRLSQLIQAIEGEQGAERLLGKLRGGPDEYISARFEIEVLERFKRSGYSLKKPMEEDGVDFTFEKGQREIFVEATHRGASWILDLVDKIFLRSFQRGFQKPSNQSVRLKLKYKRGYYTDSVVERIVHEIVKASHGFSDGFEEPECNYSISVEKSEKGNTLSIGWRWDDPAEYSYEAIRLFENKLKDKQKLKQLRKHVGSYCTVDMRSLMPGIVAWKSITIKLSSKILKGCFSYTKQFFKENPSVGGIFIWILHAGRDKDILRDTIDQNEIILVNAPHHLSEEEAQQLFPFAKLPRELDWYRANLDHGA
ncbi:hypothetical protein KA005_03415, partial [bacterium]|nr:hypothetical protein [bacterium]